MLGSMIRRARIERQMTAAELSARAGISRGLLHRIEKGDPGCAIGTVFEVAAIVGVPLFDAGPGRLTAMIDANKAVLSLLPKAVHRPRTGVNDDF